MTFTDHRETQQGKGKVNSNSSLQHPPASRTLRHKLADYCRKLTFAHSAGLGVETFGFKVHVANH